MNWNVDFDELIPFIGKTIYRAENVLVEMCANSYDADASEVKITSHADSQQIIIQDNGSGMDGDDLKELVTIAKSKKKEMVENNRLTPEYNRKVLGSFGIGIISFFALGDSIKIFTKKKGEKALFIEIKKEYENGKLKRITVSDPLEKDEYEDHLLNQEKGTTIEIHNNKLALSDNYYYRLVRFKLSNLPVSQNFKIELNGVGVNKDDFNGVDWVTKTFDFTLSNLDPDYKSDCKIHINTATTIDDFKRGIYLVVNERIIEKDLYSELYPELTSPGTIAARVRGFIKADYLSKSIQANREDFFDTQILKEIKEKIKDEINSIIEDYKLQRNTEDKEVAYNELLQRIERAKNKTSAPNQYLSQLKLNFASNPEYEQEVVIIISQLCQLGHLPFKILDYSSNSHIDCIVEWDATQIKRHPHYLAQIEVEVTLDSFFNHNHDFRTKPDICCWLLNLASFETAKKRYISKRPDSVVDIELKDAVNANDFGHQKELHFTMRNAHNELLTYIIRVYVLTEIIKKKCDELNACR